ncbi:hypothetical protein [Enterococcus thailandicus]|uniref:hypothetical protein n=1 Tax=Enterococcus thailandicus TaxID=417368 RepID=UPI00288C7CB6|nr:hypothetical protein [Enterococcus thailandicus]MDT2752710.1 hypothetical protein [Enterococcus thailandicus]MDT2776090.1 hypothetical protein [Enterococcus thailandicus]
MRTINDNFFKKTEAENRLNKLRKEFAKDEAELLNEIELQRFYIEQFNNHDDAVAIGMQLVVIRRYTGWVKELRSLLEFAIKTIKEGNLPAILEEGKVFGYWYNEGFQSGHSRTIRRWRGQDYSHERAQIRFIDEMYESEYQLTSQDTLAILACLSYRLSQLEEE